MNYELIFVMAHGMAAARKVDITKTKNSKCIHGVLHRVSRTEMDLLSKSESTYVIEQNVTIQTYKSNKELVEQDDSEGVEKTSDNHNGEDIDAVVYVLNKEIVESNPERFAEHPPGERYIDIIKDGAQHYGLDVIN